MLTLPKARQAEFMEWVYSIKSVGVSGQINKLMKNGASELQDFGAEAILAGCTEILVLKVVQYAKGTLPLRKSEN